MEYRIIRDLETFLKCIQDGSVSNSVVQGLEISQLCVNWVGVDTDNTLFLGCSLASIEEEIQLRRKGAQFFSPYANIPYNPYRTRLYTPDELMEGYDPDPLKSNPLDARINEHFNTRGGHAADVVEALYQRIHDYSIDSALEELLGRDKETKLPKKVKPIGFMGGHLARRDEPYYRQTALLARLVTRAGYLAVSGGGPGIMEAANLGAYMADYSETELYAAIEILSKQAKYMTDDNHIDPGYVGQAMAVKEKFPSGVESLAVPTWFYGNEPVNLFATHIAKYFSNSIREDGLLAISQYGVVYAPGSAATTEEVFIDAAQNHYSTFDYCSPMVFLGETHYLQSQVYQCLAQQAVGHTYAQMITISDSPQKLLEFIQKHPPIRDGN